jgi:hypothetical protein
MENFHEFRRKDETEAENELPSKSLRSDLKNLTNLGRFLTKLLRNSTKLPRNSTQLPQNLHAKSLQR